MEWFRESTRLDQDGWRYDWQSVTNEQLKSRRIPDWTGAFIGNHDVITTWYSDAFYVTEPAMSFRTFDPTLRPPRAQTAYAKGRRGRLPSPVGLGNQGLVQ